MKPGYKQTEVGVIPEDWEVVTLAEICSMKSGRTITSDSISESGRYPCFGGNGLRGYTETFTHEGTYALIGRQGALCGNVKSAAGRFFASEHAVVVAARTRTDISWLTHCLDTMGLNRLSESSAQPGLSVSKILQLPLPLPPTKAEQEAIAGALSDADAWIASLEQLIAKKRRIKEGSMQALLTAPPSQMENGKWRMENGKAAGPPPDSQFSRRLPGFSGEWEVRTLGELAEIRSGGTPSTSVPEFWDGNIPWCTPTDITALHGQKYLKGTTRSITPLGLKSSSAEMLPARSLVMTSRATIGDCAINAVPVATNQGFKNFLPLDGTDLEFLFYLLSTQTMGFISLCGGSTFLEIGKQQLLNYRVIIPPTKAEQAAIATVLSEMDDEIEALEAKLAKARQIKQGMMQELLTGRTRLV